MFSDKNECLTEEGLCSNGRCENTIGGFRCICPPGSLMTLDGRSCLGNILLIFSSPGPI